MANLTRSSINILVLFIALFCLVNCSTQKRNTKKEAKQYLIIGSSYLEQGQYPRALSALLKASQLDSENPVIQNYLGLAYFVRQKFKRAEKHINKALELSPKYTDAINNLGLVYLEQGKNKLAIQVLKRATEDLEYPHPEKTYANLGHAYLNNKQYNEAIPVLKKSLQMRRENCHTYYYYARSLFEMAQYHKANQAFRTTIKFCHKQKFPDPIYYSALSHLKVGDKQTAIAQLKEVQEYYAEFPIAIEAAKLLDIVKKGL